MAEFPGVAHIAVTVSDLGRSVPWYESLFGGPPALDEDTGPFRHVLWLLNNRTALGLHQHAQPESDLAFSELRPGLDHVGFSCADRAELERWQGRLEELGVAHGGIVEAPYGYGLSFRDPDNIALEFFSPPR